MYRLLIFFVIICFASCSNEQDASNEFSSKATAVAYNEGIAFYGSAFAIDQVITPQNLRARIDSMADSHAVIMGKVADVCKKEGCWLNLDLGGNNVMQVNLHKFHVPRDCEGKTAYICGHAYLDTTSVKQLRNFAADAGEPDSEIESITQPRVEMIFEAEGVGLK